MRRLHALARGLILYVTRANATGAQHWDGNSWTLVSTPYSRNGKTFTESALNGADALSSNNIWAVGYALPSESRSRVGYETLIERWDGTAWKLVESPNAGTNTNTLTGVDALTNNLAYAVGYYRAGQVRNSLIERWDGTSWNVLPNPNIGGSGSALLDVAAISANDIWAVGYKTFSNKGAEPLVLHYDAPLGSRSPRPPSATERTSWPASLPTQPTTCGRPATTSTVPSTRP